MLTSAVKNIKRCLAQYCGSMVVPGNDLNFSEKREKVSNGKTGQLKKMIPLGEHEILLNLK